MNEKPRPCQLEIIIAIGKCSFPIHSGGENGVP